MNPEFSFDDRRFLKLIQVQLLVASKMGCFQVTPSKIGWKNTNANFVQ